MRASDPTKPHLLRRGAVDAWLVDSVIKSPTYHRTSPAAAHDILEHGADPERSAIGAFGQGFYTSTQPDSFHGTAEVEVAVRTRDPMIGHIDDLEPAIDDLGRRLRPEARGRMTRDVAAAIRQELLDLGYDGIVIQDAGGDGVDYVVALLDETVKVVIDQ